MDRITTKRQQIAVAFELLRRDGHLKSLTVGQVMTPGPTCVAREQTVYELVKMVRANCFRHLLVTGQEQLVGVISDRDIILCFSHQGNPSSDYLKGITAGELMSTDLVVVEPATPLVDAIHLLIDCGINCLPVVAKGAPIGIVTSTDLFLTLEQLLHSLLASKPALSARRAL